MGFDRPFAHREDLLVAALDEFAAQGFEKASVNRILATAGVSKGQLYHHFGSKEGLYLAVVEHVLARKRAHFGAQPVAPDADFFATLRAQVAEGIAFSRAHPRLERFSRSFLAERGRPIFDTVVARFGFAATDGVRPMIEHHARRGDFRQELPVDFVRRAVSVVLDRLPELLDLRAPDEVESQLDLLIGFLRRGLSAP